MHYDIIEIPEVNVGKLVGQNPLNLRVDLFAFCLVHGASPRVDQVIDLRIYVKPSIRMPGRKARGVKGIIKDVRIFIASDPAQGVKLEGSFLDVGVKCGKLKAAN